MTILDLRPGDHATVTGISGQGAVRQRLLDMGILPQTKLTVARIAPGGGPIWLVLGESQFALRSEEAKTVLVERVPGDPT